MASIHASANTIAAITIDPTYQESQPSTQAGHTEYALAGPRFPSAPPSSLASTVSVHLTPTTVAGTTVGTMPSQPSQAGTPLNPGLNGDHEHLAPSAIDLPPNGSLPPTLPVE